MLIFEAEPRGGRYLIMNAYVLADGQFERMQVGAERLGGTTYLRSSVRGQAVAPPRRSLKDKDGGGETQYSMRHLHCRSQLYFRTIFRWARHSEKLLNTMASGASTTYRGCGVKDIFGIIFLMACCRAPRPMSTAKKRSV